MAETKAEESKLKSRKFVVWLVWLLITLAIVAISFFRNTADSLVSKTLDNFFFISMMYLGMNVGQKGFYAIAGALKNGESNKESNTDSN